ncbi:predicted protein [Streptomyces sp. C]|nr:predicted protein [Streptomyces sp. C]
MDRQGPPPAPVAGPAAGRWGDGRPAPGRVGAPQDTPALQGAIFAVVKAAVDRGGAAATRRVTGTGPA